MPQITTLERLAEIIPDASARASAKIFDHLDEQSIAFIGKSQFMLIATEGPDGLEVSPKGDAPGFVHVLDNKTLIIPERNGNQLKMGLRNILAGGRVALIFLCPPTGDAVRVSGRATLHDDAEWCARLTGHGKPALLTIKVEIDRAFFHCPRAILRSDLWNPDSWSDAMKVSYGKIYATALGRPEVEAELDLLAAKYNAEL